MRKKINEKAGSVLAWLLAMTMIISLMPMMALTTSAAVKYNNGTFEGSGRGFGGEVTVNLTIQDDKMTALSSPSHSDESFWGSRNVDSLLTAILSANSESIVGTDGVDSVTGATSSSNGVKAAVKDALSKAVDSGIFTSGEGTENNPYLIETADQMREFAKSVDAGTSYEAEYIALGTDVELSGSDWNPIGTEATVAAKDEDSTNSIFKGNFDGQGYTVSGLTIIDSTLDSESNLVLKTSGQSRI